MSSTPSKIDLEMLSDTLELLHTCELGEYIKLGKLECVAIVSEIEHLQSELDKLRQAAIDARSLLAKLKRWNDCDDERVTHEAEMEVLNEVCMDVNDVLNNLSAALPREK